MTIWESMFVEFDERIAETEQLVTVQNSIVTALMRIGEDAREARQRLLEQVDVLRTLNRRRALLVQLLREAADPARESSPEACQP